MTEGGGDPPRSADGRPLPRLADEPYAEPFWAGTREGELRLQWCPDCGEAQFFPGPWCKRCGREDLEWRVASGEGRVYAHTTVRRAVQEPAFEEAIPYVLAHVDLAEGPRMFTALVDCSPDEVENGMPVTAVFERVTDEVTLPKFRPRATDTAESEPASE